MFLEFIKTIKCLLYKNLDINLEEKFDQQLEVIFNQKDPWDIVLHNICENIRKLKIDELSKLKYLEKCYYMLYKRQLNIEINKDELNIYLNESFKTITKKNKINLIENTIIINGINGHNSLIGTGINNNITLANKYGITVKDIERPSYDLLDNGKKGHIDFGALYNKIDGELIISLEEVANKCLCVSGHIYTNGYSFIKELYPDPRCSCLLPVMTLLDIKFLNQALFIIDRLEPYIAKSVIRELRVNNYLAKNDDGYGNIKVGYGLHPCPITTEELSWDNIGFKYEFEQDIFYDYNQKWLTDHNGSSNSWFEVRKKIRKRNNIKIYDQIVITKSGFKKYTNQKLLSISHTWDNSVENFYRILRNVDKWLDYFEADAIWWDTIATPEDQNSRQNMIKEMAEIYHKSKATIIMLGSGDTIKILKLWHQHGIHPRNAMRCTKWASRAWTYQEEILPLVLFLDLPEGFINIRHISTTASHLGFTNDYIDFSDPKEQNLSHCHMMCSNRKITNKFDYPDCFAAIGIAEENIDKELSIDLGILSLLRIDKKSFVKLIVTELNCKEPCWRANKLAEKPCFWTGKMVKCKSRVLYIDEFLKVTNLISKPKLKTQLDENIIKRMEIVIETYNENLLVSLASIKYNYWHILAVTTCDKDEMEVELIKNTIHICN